MTVTDANGKTDDHAVQWVIDPEVSITSSALPDGTDTGNYGPVTVTTTGGVGPLNFGATSLPTGLSINANSGAISGTIAANQSNSSPFSVTLIVTDTNNYAVQVTLNLVVNSSPSLAISTLPTGALNTPYQGATLTALGGTGPFNWVVNGLPDGLTANPDGTISGTIAVTNTPGLYTISITVTDANGVSNISKKVKRCGLTETGESADWVLLALLLTLLAVARRRVH